MKNPQWQNRETDELAGSPELFATNLLMVRALENSLKRIEIRNQDNEITVQLFADDNDYERETLTEDTGKWTDILDRFREITDFYDDGTDHGELQPNLPNTYSYETIEATYEDSKLTITFQYED